MANVTPINRAITAAVSQDSELAEEARALARKAIETANYYLDHGSPKVQLDVIKSIMPAIGRGMTEKGESDELAELRVQLAALMLAVTGDSQTA
jgi:hypothetical protein